MNTAEYLYHAWHDAAKSRDTDALIALYHDDAELESPLVPIIMQRTNGTLRGKAEIRAFLAEGARRRPNEWVRWYRDAHYYTGGDILIWEYPRQTPNGNQVDILELMQHRDGKIYRHRIYWGWFGTQMLIKSALTKQDKTPT
mgnify:FL=1